MRWVITGTGLEKFVHRTSKLFELSCETAELGELRVALQRAIDEIDEEIVEADRRPFMSRQITKAMDAYAAEKAEQEAKDADAG